MEGTLVDVVPPNQPLAGKGSQHMSFKFYSSFVDLRADLPADNAANRDLCRHFVRSTRFFVCFFVCFAVALIFNRADGFASKGILLPRGWLLVVVTIAFQNCIPKCTLTGKLLLCDHSLSQNYVHILWFLRHIRGISAMSKEMSKREESGRQ